MRQPLLILLLTTLLLFGTGCMTGGVWSEAGPERMGEPFVAGQIRAAGGSEGAGRPTALVVSYTLPYTFRPHQPPRLWARVPLDAAGAPAEPFAYRGAANGPADVIAGLSPVQLAAARAATAHASFGSGTSPRSLAGFHTFDAEPIRPGHTYMIRRDDVLIFVYRIDAQTGALVPLYEDEPWPPDAHVAVLPTDAARPPGDKSNATARAALLTPLMIGLDILTIPLAIYAMATGQIC